MVVWLMILGCSGFSRPMLLSPPAEVRSGAEVRLTGTGIDPAAPVTWRSDAQTVPGSLRAETEGLTLVVPELPPGEYAVEIQQGDEPLTFETRVLAPPPETPCKRGYEVNTEISMVDRIAVVEQFFPDGKRERAEITLADVERLELQQTELDGETCWAILLRRNDGVSILFEDGSSDLTARAHTLAGFMKKPLVEQ